MNRNITFSADETLIEEAREAARLDNTTLNGQFRLWLESYARRRRAKIRGADEADQGQIQQRRA